MTVAAWLEVLFGGAALAGHLGPRLRARRKSPVRVRGSFHVPEELPRVFSTEFFLILQEFSVSTRFTRSFWECHSCQDRSYLFAIVMSLFSLLTLVCCSRC